MSAPGAGPGSGQCPRRSEPGIHAGGLGWLSWGTVDL